VALHIPDGFLSAPVSLLGWLLAAILTFLAVRHTSQAGGDKSAPIMGVLAAFIFAAQAINFPIWAGTSGHIVGAGLAAILVGPWAATLLMTAVVLIQGLLFQDGGLLVMGCNILNMGALAVFAAYASYSILLRMTSRRSVAAFAGAWISVVVSAAATALELGISGTFPTQLALPSLTGIYALVGLGEGIVTAAAVSLVQSSRPELLQQGVRVRGRAAASLLTAGMTGSLALVLVSPLASSSPDGLEKVAQTAGFDHLAQVPWLGVFPDYTVALFSHSAISVVVAMILGTVAVFGLVMALTNLNQKVEE
jgi:cobalt/nickel transport system permease protein